MPESAAMVMGSTRRTPKNKEGGRFVQSKAELIRSLIREVKALRTEEARKKVVELYQAAASTPGLTAFTIAPHGLTPGQSAQINQMWQAVNGSMGRRVTCDIADLRN